MNIFRLVLSGGSFYRQWWVAVYIFRLMVGRGGYNLAGGGQWWMVVGGGGYVLTGGE